MLSDYQQDRETTTRLHKTHTLRRKTREKRREQDLRKYMSPSFPPTAFLFGRFTITPTKHSTCYHPSRHRPISSLSSLLRHNTDVPRSHSPAPPPSPSLAGVEDEDGATGVPEGLGGPAVMVDGEGDVAGVNDAGYGAGRGSGSGSGRGGCAVCNNTPCSWISRKDSFASTTPPLRCAIEE